MTQRASSLLLLNSYGIEDDDDENVQEENEEQKQPTQFIETIQETIITEVSEKSTHVVRTSSYSLVGYGHDDADGDLNGSQDGIAGASIIQHYTLKDETITEPADAVYTQPASPTDSPASPPLEELNKSLSFRCEAFLQPEPDVVVESEVQEKIMRCFVMKSEGKSINDCRNLKRYKNPDILEKLVQHCDINEIGSNYPQTVFDHSDFISSDYYDSIAIEQRRMEEKRPEERSGKTIEFTSVGATGSVMTSNKDDKKKSKWDSMDSSAVSSATNRQTQQTQKTQQKRQDESEQTEQSKPSEQDQQPPQRQQEQKDEQSEQKEKKEREKEKEVDKEQQSGSATGSASVTVAPSANPYVEYIRDRKKREGTENSQETTKKSKK